MLRKVRFFFHTAAGISLNPGKASFFHHCFRFHGIQIFKEHKISQFSRTNHSSVIQMHSSGRCISGTVNCLFHRHSCQNSCPHNLIQMPLQKLIRHNIIRYKCSIFVQIIMVQRFYHLGRQGFSLQFQKHSKICLFQNRLGSLLSMIRINSFINKPV